jgi:hypothetical protein
VRQTRDLYMVLTIHLSKLKLEMGLLRFYIKPRFVGNLDNHEETLFIILLKVNVPKKSPTSGVTRKITALMTDCTAIAKFKHTQKTKRLVWKPRRLLLLNQEKVILKEMNALNSQ